MDKPGHISSFDYLNGEATITEFLEKLRETNIFAVDIVFLSLVDNCDSLASMRDNFIVKILKNNRKLGRGTMLSGYEYDVLSHYKRTLRGPPKDAIEYAWYSMSIGEINKSVWTMFTRAFNSSMCGDDILPHLKLALAYCEWTNGTHLGR